MKISELVNTLEELMDKFGDVDVKTLDIDSKDCDVEEVIFYENPYPHIFIC